MNDDSKMYFGKYKDKKLADVPASYLLWLGDQDWIGSHNELLEYIETNRKGLEDEAEHDRTRRYASYM